jgi:parallel beta-helix repeat protein
MSPVVRTPFVMTLCVAVFLFVATSFAQNTINVPGDQPTIQGAINAANNGDTVLIAPGTYYENINFNGKAVTVTSSGGPSVTIIDGGQNGSVVTFDSGETMSSGLNGVAIRNGYASYNGSYDSGRGGGIQIMNSSPTVTGNLISNNSALCGMGIYIDGGSPVIKNNTISNNTQPSNDGGCGGGGIEATGSSTSPSSPLIEGNVITNNNLNAGGGGFGGGIYVYDFSQPTIRNNVIKGNTAYNGGGIAISSSLGTVVVQNLIANNTSLYTGAGLYVVGSNVNVANNTIVGNLNSSGIFVWSNSPQTITVSNNIVVAAAGQSYAITCAPALNTLSPVFSRNDVYIGWSGVCDYTASPGNISADPLFVNSASDFHLQPNSPAIDAGTNSAPNLPQTDFSGNPRILDGNNDCLSTVDLGAYELVRTANVSFSRNALTFGSQVPGTSSSPQSVTLNNTGGTCFQFSGVGITGDFSQANTCSAAGVRAGTSCFFNVTFSPTALGTRLGALTVSGSDGITSASPSVNLSGVGVDFSIAASPASASVKHGQSVKFTVTVNPLGGSFSSAVALSCSGLPSGASCTFSPSSLTPGERGATSVMTVSTVGKTPRGNYNVLIVGKSGSDSHSTTVLLSVN